MRAAVRIDFNLIPAEQELRTDRLALGHQCIRNKDCMIRAFLMEELVERSISRVVAITNAFAIHTPDAVSRADQAVCPVVKRRHAVVHMRHRTCAVCIRHHRLLIGRSGVTDADNHAVLATIPGQRKVLIGFGCHGDILNQPVCSLLIFLKLLYRGLDNILFRLRTLVYHIKIRPLKVYAQNFRALVAVRDHLCHVLKRRGQNLFALGDRGRQKSGHAFADDVAHPVTQALFLCVVGIKAVSAVAVHVDKTGQNAFAAIIPVNRFRIVCMDTHNFSAIHLDLRRYKLVGKPDFFTLNYHFPYLLLS